MTIPEGLERISFFVDIARKFISADKYLWYIVHPNDLPSSKIIRIEGEINHELLSVRCLWRTDHTLKNITIWSVDTLRDNLSDVVLSGKQNLPDLLVVEDLECLAEPYIGSKLEELMLRLPQEISIVALVSFVPNLQEIVCWLETVRQRPCRWIDANIPKNESVLAFLTPEKTLIPLCNKKRVSNRVKRLLKETDPPSAITSRKFLKPLISMLRKEKITPTLILMSSEKDCDDAVRNCSVVNSEAASVLTSPEIVALFERHPILKGREDVLDVLYRRVASFHLADHPDWREMIDTFFSLNHIDAIFATIDSARALMTGVRSIVFTTSQVRTYVSSQMRQVTKRELFQACKLLGKHGADDLGCIITVNTKDTDIVHIKELYTGRPDPLSSRFYCSYQTVLGLCATNETDPGEAMPRSLFANQRDREDTSFLSELLDELQEKIPESACDSPRAAIALMDIYSQLIIQADKAAITIKKDKVKTNKGAVEQKIAKLQSLISQLPCEKCVHQENCQRMKYRKIRTIVYEYNEALRGLRSKSSILDIDFNDHKELLIKFEFIDAGQTLSNKGLIALRTGLEFPQLVVECAQKGVIPLDDTSLSSAVVAGFVECSVGGKPRLVDDFVEQSLLDAYAKINDVTKPFDDRLLASGILMPGPSLAQSAVSLACEKGIDLDVVASKAEVSLGSLVKLIYKERYLKQQLMI